MSEEDIHRTAVPLLQKGITDVQEIVDILLHFKCSETARLKQVIGNAQRCFEKSEKSADGQLKSVDKKCEMLICNKGKLEAEKKHLHTQMENLETERAAIDKNLQSCKDELSRAQDDARRARNKVQRYKNKQSDAETGAYVGLGLMVIPVIGWIPGAILTSACVAEMETARKQAQEAKEEVGRWDSQVRSLGARLDRNQAQKREKEEKIDLCNRSIIQTEKSLKEVKDKQNKMADFQQKLRKTAHFLSVLAGRAVNANEMAKQRLLLLKPLHDIMQEIVEWLIQATNCIDRQTLVQTPGIIWAIEDLKQTVPCLKSAREQCSLEYSPSASWYE